MLSNTVMANKQQSNQWASQVNDLIRGTSGGFLFSIPLIYTMEVWWVGSFITPPRMFMALVTTFIAVFLLNRTAGFRRVEGIRLSDVAIETTEALALGIVCTALMLVLIRRITLQTPPDEIVGKTIFEAVTFAIGSSLANQFLSSGRSENQDKQHQSQQDDKHYGSGKQSINATFADVGATMIGTIFIASNIAPTREVPTIAAALTPPWLLALITFSLVVSYGIVFEAGFGDQQKRQQQQGIFQQPLSETVASYLVSLVITAFMLWFFKQLTLDDPWQLWLTHTLVLGLPATIGGAAGRLAV